MIVLVPCHCYSVIHTLAVVISAVLSTLQDQKGANGVRQNGHAKMSAKPLFQKNNNGERLPKEFV